MTLLLFDMETQDKANGWRPYEYSPPMDNWLYIEIWRRDWPGPKIVSFAELNPMMNVYGLWWRPV